MKTGETFIGRAGNTFNERDAMDTSEAAELIAAAEWHQSRPYFHPLTCRSCTYREPLRVATGPGVVLECLWLNDRAAGGHLNLIPA